MTEQIYKHGHWETTEVIDTEKYIGFTYCIINKKNNRKYLGCKKYVVKKKSAGNWKDYTGSNTELNKDIIKDGKVNFSFVILKQYTRMPELKYAEAKLIMVNDAILSADYYNQMVFLRMKGKKQK